MYVCVLEEGGKAWLSQHKLFSGHDISCMSQDKRSSHPGEAGGISDRRSSRCQGLHMGGQQEATGGEAERARRAGSGWSSVGLGGGLGFYPPTQWKPIEGFSSSQ